MWTGTWLLTKGQWVRGPPGEQIASEAEVAGKTPNLMLKLRFPSGFDSYHLRKRRGSSERRALR